MENQPGPSVAETRRFSAIHWKTILSLEKMINKMTSTIWGGPFFSEIPINLFEEVAFSDLIGIHLLRMRALGKSTVLEKMPRVMSSQAQFCVSWRERKVEICNMSFARERQFIGNFNHERFSRSSLVGNWTSNDWWISQVNRVPFTMLLSRNLRDCPEPALNLAYQNRCIAPRTSD